MTETRRAAKIEFKPSARLQRYLGQELISDPNLAIIEFVKNAYDAGATKVNIEFVLNAHVPSLVIADNGCGMSEDEFRANWMRPGFSHKAVDAPPRPPVTGPGARSDARKWARARIPAGEKGIGRMSAGRLGACLEVYTRPAPQVPWLHVPFDWAMFDDMTKSMDQIKVQPDYATDPPDQAYESGTVIVISGLRQRWDGKIRGRPVRGRSRTKIGRLRQDLEFLMRPLAPQFGGFAIEVQSDSVAEAKDNGPIKVAAVDLAGYQYTFKCSRNKAGFAVVERTIRRSSEIADEFDLPAIEEVRAEVVKIPDADGKKSSTNLRCGPFEGTFYYSPPAAAKRAAAILPMGVLLYRDGVWVEPYGIDEDDWLGAEARKAARQGHAAIQPNAITGSVLIGRKDNPELYDMSNRMGLLENEESEEFLTLVRAEFLKFESIVQKEIIEPRWDENQAKSAVKKAGGEVQVATTFMRSLAHSVRQPLEGIQVELGIIEQVAKQEDVPKDARLKLEGVLRRATRHADSAGRLLQEALRFEVPQFSEVPLRDVLDEVERQCRADAESRGVTVEWPTARNLGYALVPRQLVVQAVSAVVGNAIQAPRNSPTALVAVDVGDTENGDPYIRVSDNGTGIADYVPGQDLSSVRSTHGRPAVGLRMAELATTTSLGRLTVETTGETGTVMLIELPEVASGLRG